MDVGSLVANFVAQKQEQRNRWVNSLRRASETAKEMALSGKVKRNIDGLLAMLPTKCPELQAKLQAELAGLPRQGANDFERLGNSLQQQFEWLETMSSACLAKKPKRYDLAKLALEEQRKVLVAESCGYWDGK